MRIIILPLALLMSVAGLAGCSSDSEGRPSQNLVEQTDLARRHFLHGVDLLSQPRQAPDGSPLTTGDRPDALQAMEKAQQVLRDALRNEGGSAMAKVTAETMLAKVQKAIGDYHARLADEALTRADGSIFSANRTLDLAASQSGTISFYQKALELKGQELQSLLQQSQQSRQQLSQRIDAIKQSTAALQAEVDALASQTSQLEAQASDLTARSQSGSAREGLELLKQAAGIQKSINANYQADSEKRAAMESAVREQKRAEIELIETDKRIAALTELSKGIDDGLAQVGTELQKTQGELTATMGRLASEVSQVSKEFASAKQSAQQAAVAYDDAGKAASNATAGATSRQEQANKALQESPTSAAAEAMALINSPTEKRAAVDLRGVIAMSAGEIRRKMLAAEGRIQAFAKGASGFAGKTGLTLPAGVAELASLSAGGQEYRTEAVEAYQAASGYFESAARMLSREPVNTTATKWLYQYEQAMALYGQYQLSGDAQLLSQARDIVSTILSDQSDNPFIEPARQLNQLLSQVRS